LAVGDAAFQQKCLQKVEESSSGEGRTVIFVSHNMSAVRQLCEKVAWLENGRLKQIGPAEEVTAAYLKSMESLARSLPLNERKDRKGNGEIRITHLNWKTADGILISGAPASLEIKLNAPLTQSIGSLNFRINVMKHNGEFVGSLSNNAFGQPLQKIDIDSTITCNFESLPLTEGRYYLNANLYHNSRKADKVERALDFKVEAGDFSGTGANMNLVKEGARLPQNWEAKK